MRLIYFISVKKRIGEVLFAQKGDYMFNKHDLARNSFQLFGGQAKCGYDWWWHSLTAVEEKTEVEKAFFFEFFICNPNSGKEEAVLGQLPDNKANNVKPSYLMVKAGTWGADARQMHRFFGWKEISISPNTPIAISAEDCFLSEEKMSGSINISEEEVNAHPEWMCQAGNIKFDLKINKQIAFNVGYGAGKLFRHLQAFEMFWHAEGMKTCYEGEIEYNGKKYIVKPETCYGYADKNWGKDFTSPWVWLSSNDLVSEITGKRLTNSVFDIGGGCPKVGPISLPRKLLAAFYYEGKEYEFNFSKFWMGVKTKFECNETDTQIIWHVEQTNWTSKMVTDVTCEKKDMLLINYEAPNGAKKHNRLWNGGNGIGTISIYHKNKLVDRIRAEHIGCEYGEYCE